MEIKVRPKNSPPKRKTPLILKVWPKARQIKLRPVEKLPPAEDFIGTPVIDNSDIISDTKKALRSLGYKKKDADKLTKQTFELHPEFTAEEAVTFCIQNAEDLL